MNRVSIIFLHILFINFFFISCKAKNQSESLNQEESPQSSETINFRALAQTDSISFEKRLSYAAQSIIDPSIIYDPSYKSIPYPNGDVAANRGVCTDVIIRAYRVLSIDLQQLVHEDMKANFSLYPNLKMWGLKATDKNIDHRRVPNLQVFFKRKGVEKSISNKLTDYSSGDIVVWKLPNGLLHIGIVIDKKMKDGTPIVVHNIGRGQVAENVLFAWDIIGYYSYQGTI